MISGPLQPIMSVSSQQDCTRVWMVELQALISKLVLDCPASDWSSMFVADDDSSFQVSRTFLDAEMACDCGDRNLLN